MSNLNQLLDSLEPSQKRNFMRYLNDQRGISATLHAPISMIYVALKEAGQDVLDSIETQKQLTLYVVDALAQKNPIFGLLAPAFREAVQSVEDEGASTDYLKDFPVFQSVIETGLALQNAGEA